MTITNRLSWFFMSMLTVVLFSFSLAIYLSGRHFRNLEEFHRVTATLNALSNVIEFYPDGVEWESYNRSLRFEDTSAPGRIIWFVADESGQIIDRSQGSDFEPFLRTLPKDWFVDQGEVDEISLYLDGWLARQRWVRADPKLVTRTASTIRNDNQERSAHGVTADKQSETEANDLIESPAKIITYPKLLLTVGLSLTPVREMLYLLLLSLIWFSTAIWMICFLVSRFVCRRALLPLTQMAIATRQIDANDLAHQRLPVVKSNDELQELNGAFNQLLDRLHETFARQRRFTGDASHQLRTPLTAITGQIEVALRRERRAEDYRQVLVTVQQKSVHLAKLVESLLFLARNDADAANPTLENLDLTAWLPELLKSWSHHPRYRDFHFENRSPNACLVRVQPALLAELLNILIDNACKYSLPGKPITVGLASIDNRTVITVEDRGCGIDPGEFPNLFVPFFRSADVRRQGIEGVGLGLSIAKRLAALFNAELLASSTAGEGSCFTLRFNHHPDVSS